eukprot:gene14454-5123_t
MTYEHPEAGRRAWPAPRRRRVRPRARRLHRRPFLAAFGYNVCDKSHYDAEAAVRVAFFERSCAAGGVAGGCRGGTAAQQPAELPEGLKGYRARCGGRGGRSSPAGGNSGRVSSHPGVWTEQCMHVGAGVARGPAAAAAGALRPARVLARSRRADTYGDARARYWRLRNPSVAGLGRYKFVVAMENTWLAGHHTEKLPLPILAGAVPVYFGHPTFSRLVNPARVVYCNVSGAAPPRARRAAAPASLEAIRRLRALRLDAGLANGTEWCTGACVTEFQRAATRAVEGELGGCLGEVERLDADDAAYGRRRARARPGAGAARGGFRGGASSARRLRARVVSQPALPADAHPPHRRHGEEGREARMGIFAAAAFGSMLRRA